MEKIFNQQKNIHVKLFIQPPHKSTSICIYLFDFISYVNFLKKIYLNIEGISKTQLIIGFLSSGAYSNKLG